jgi:D-inositol-3-phosphate glycosyltransferase
MSLLRSDKEVMKPRLLFIGDAAVSSGFARVTHSVLDVAKETWDVSVLGINYTGDPHEYPYKIYPPHRTSPWGLSRVKELAANVDLVVIQNDPWNVPMYAKEIGQTPMVAVMPVDGRNCRGHALNGLDHAIWWTEFGKKEAELGGYTGPSTVIPLGVDLAKYTPRDKVKVRNSIGLEPQFDDMFIVGNVNRNQPRKRLDLTLQYFYEWINKEKIDDAYLYLHICPTGDRGYDLENLARYYRGDNGLRRLILVQPDIGQGDPEEKLAMSYSAFDVQISTTQGEGWGLTTLEGMACGVPQIVPDWSALGEWAAPAAHRVPVCDEYCVTPGNGIDVVGAVPKKKDFIQTLHDAYCFPDERKAMSRAGIALAYEDRFRWQNIGKRYVEVFDSVLENVRRENDEIEVNRQTENVEA